MGVGGLVMYLLLVLALIALAVVAAVFMTLLLDRALKPSDATPGGFDVVPTAKRAEPADESKEPERR